MSDPGHSLLRSSKINACIKLKTTEKEKEIIY